MVRIIYVILGVILPLSVIILLNIPSTVTFGEVLRWVFYIFPIYALDLGIMTIAE